jgi:hypothetical protein
MARERHVAARRLLATGVDPMAQRKAEKRAERDANENSFATGASGARQALCRVADWDGYKNSCCCAVGRGKHRAFGRYKA